MTDVSAFIKRWDGKTLEDWGTSVSREFTLFQRAFIKEVDKIAHGLGGSVVKSFKGHYDITCFVKVGEKYIYVNYDNSCGYGGRAHITLTRRTNGGGFWYQPLMLRTARNDRDYIGGANEYCPFTDLERFIDNLLKEV